MKEEKMKISQKTNLKADVLEQMLQSAYSQETVPNEVKLRLQNRIAYQKVVKTGNVSFWWLPAAIATSVSFATAVFLCLVYVIVNIVGVNTWMPNLLQFVSEIWLKMHLIAIVLEVIVSWLITFVGIWKGNLIKSAKIF